jgi:hypothetical protein
LCKEWSLFDIFFIFIGINCLFEKWMVKPFLCPGGPAIVCSRWDQEVRETRHHIMAAARYLMKNDMMFVAEREVEIHI